MNYAIGDEDDKSYDSDYSCHSRDYESLQKCLKSDDKTECETISTSSSHSSDDMEAMYSLPVQSGVFRRRDFHDYECTLHSSESISLSGDSMSFESDHTMASPLKKERTNRIQRTFKANTYLWAVIMMLILCIIYEPIYRFIWQARIWPAEKMRIQKEIRRFHVEQIAATQQLAGGYAVQEHSIAFTVLLQPNSHTPRWDLIRSSLDAHANCPHVQQIVIEHAPTDIYQHISGKVISSISPNDLTPSILMLSGDSVFTCDELTRGFELWKKHPDRMVGFYPYRSHKSVLEKVSLGEGKYSFISNRAAFLHRAYLEPTKVLEDKVCQQLALSVRISAISDSPPLAVMANPLELRTTIEKPTSQTIACLSKLISTYQMPTIPVESQTYVVQS